MVVVVEVGEDVVDELALASAPQAASNTSINPIANHLVVALNSPHLIGEIATNQREPLVPISCP